MNVNGWTLYWHPAFQEKFENLLAIVQDIQANRPQDLEENGHAKLLKRIVDIMVVEIPQDPDHAKYIQGNTLGKAYRNWRRAKFLQRFRLFFKFSSTHKIIIFAWVNDSNTLRQTGAKTDPYTVFAKKLISGEPPDDWDDLLKSCNEIKSLTLPKSTKKTQSSIEAE